MILVDEKQITPEDFCEKMGIPMATLAAIKKQSVFKFNEELKAYDLGSRQLRPAEPHRFPSTFIATDANGTQKEVRYATRKTKIRDKVSRSLIDIYTPKKTGIDGDFTLCDKLDHALFLYAHPKCKTSPFRGTDPWTYEFVDKQAIAKTGLGKANIMREALNHASAAKGADLRYIAKGMGIASVDDMASDVEIQAALSELALINAVSYMEKVGKQTTKLDGRIIDAVDRNVFRLDTSYGIPKWLWNKGQNKGQLICEVTNQSIGATVFLKNFIKANINDYHASIMRLSEEEDSNTVAEKFLKDNPDAKEVYVEDLKSGLVFDTDGSDEDDDLGLEVLEDEIFEEAENIAPPIFDDPTVESHDDDDEDSADEPAFPTDFKSSVEYITHFKGSRASATEGKRVTDAIRDENIQPTQMRGWLRENMGY